MRQLMGHQAFVVVTLLPSQPNIMTNRKCAGMKSRCTVMSIIVSVHSDVAKIDTKAGLHELSH
jgi:hypothetical protein